MAENLYEFILNLSYAIGYFVLGGLVLEMMALVYASFFASDVAKMEAAEVMNDYIRRAPDGRPSGAAETAAQLGAISIFPTRVAGVFCLYWYFLVPTTMVIVWLFFLAAPSDRHIWDLFWRAAFP